MRSDHPAVSAYWRKKAERPQETLTNTTPSLKPWGTCVFSLYVGMKQLEGGEVKTNANREGFREVPTFAWTRALEQIQLQGELCLPADLCTDDAKWESLKWQPLPKSTISSELRDHFSNGVHQLAARGFANSNDFCSFCLWSREIYFPRLSWTVYFTLSTNSS